MVKREKLVAEGGQGVSTSDRSSVQDRRETVDHPLHYGGDTTYEVIKVIEAWELGFNLGTCIKHIGRKPEGKVEAAAIGKTPEELRIDDLKKAAWYLNREIGLLEKKKNGGNGSA